MAGIDEIHVSIAFVWDVPQAAGLARDWGRAFPTVPVKLGGPALDDPGGDFVPGRYLAPGFTITSRGCPKKCPFCFVPKREGPLRELPIRDGWIINDNNLLACSRGHIERVFEMIDRVAPAGRRIEFPGGLDALYLEDWQVERIAGYGPRLRSLFLAYDRPGTLAPVQAAVEKFRNAGVPREKVKVYVLAGFENDDPRAAINRVREVYAAGAVPCVMLYQGTTRTEYDRIWKRIQKVFIRPILTSQYFKANGEAPEGPAADIFADIWDLTRGNDGFGRQKIPGLGNGN